MRPGIVTRLTLAAVVVSAVVLMGMRAGGADTSTQPSPFAGGTGSTQPASTPVATSRPPATKYVAQAPPGYHIIGAGGREAICLPADDTWVKAALQQAGPAEKPTTMPSDVVTRLTIHHDDLAHDMSNDLGLTDTKDAVDFLDNTLRPAVRKMVDVKPRVLYLVASTSQIVDFLKAGWKEPHYHYNIYTGAPSLDDLVPYGYDNGDLDDLIAPVIGYDPTVKDAAAKQATMQKAVQQTDTYIKARSNGLVPTALMRAFMAFIVEKGITPLHLSLDEEWFGRGTVEVLASKYTSDLWGYPWADVMAGLSQPSPNNPMTLDSVDALHPIALDKVQPNLRAYYLDALTHKSASAVYMLVTSGNEAAIGRVIAKLRVIAAETPAPSTEPTTRTAAASPMGMSLLPTTRLVGVPTTRMSGAPTTGQSASSSTMPTTMATTEPSPPRFDGVALVAMIKEMTNVDLTHALTR